MPNAPVPPPPPRYLPAEDRLVLEEAALEARQAWDGVRRQGAPAEKAKVLDYLAGCVCDLEGPGAALRLARRANRLWRTAGDPDAIATSGASLAMRLLDAGRTQEALRQSAEAREAMAALPGKPSHLQMRAGLGRTFLQAGHAAEAQAWLESALAALEGTARARALVHLARALDLQGRTLEALAAQEEAAAAFHAQKENLAMADAMVQAARLYLRLGRKWEAGELCLKAARILDRRGRKAEAAAARELHGLCGPAPRPRRTGRGFAPTRQPA